MDRPIQRFFRTWLISLAAALVPLCAIRAQAPAVNPCLHWFTYYGGEATDHGRRVCVDRNGNIIVAGITASQRFPVQGGFQMQHAGNLDAFVVKMTRDGRVLWSTYYGGRGMEEVTGVAVDPAGNVILSGFTSSTDFPVSENAPQKTLAGKNDAFVVSFAPDGTRNWATYFGGSFSDEANGLAVDSDGNIIICGGSYSTNYPVSDKALQPSNGGDYDVFVTKFSKDGDVKWSTYYGGWSLDYAKSVTVDARGAITVTGYTEGRNFPVTSGAWQKIYGGGTYDAFVLRLTAAGGRSWATFMGGSDADQAADIAGDDDGNVVITGYTGSGDLCASNGVGQTTNAGKVDAFVAKFDDKGMKTWSTYFGSKRLDDGAGIAMLPNGAIAVCGYTESGDLSVSPYTFVPKSKGLVDAFVALFGPDGALAWSTYLAGKDWDAAYGIAADQEGNIVVTGGTASTDLAVTANALQPRNAGFEDAFIARIVFNIPRASAGDDRTVCLGAPAKLEGAIKGGHEPFAYHWTPTAGLDDPDSPTPVATPAVTTTYTLSVQDGSGCVSADTVTVTVLPAPSIALADLVELCAGGTTQLTPVVTGGKEPYTYAWLPESEVAAPASATPDVSPKTTTTYHLLVTDANSCIATDSIVVHVNETPVANAGENTSICLGGSVAIGAEAKGGTPPYRYRWTPAEGLDNAEAATPGAHPPATTVYHLEVTDAAGCRDEDSVSVMVLPLPVVDAGEDRRICPGATAVLESAVSGGKPPYAYAWTPAEGLEQTTTKRVAATPTQTTTYVLTVTDARGCSASDSVNVQVPPVLAVTVDDHAGMCAGGSVTLKPEVTGGTPPYAYAWKPLAGLTATDAADPVAQPEKSTLYTVTVTDANGCQARNAVQVTVFPLPKVRATRPQIVCPGGSANLVAAASSGTPPFTYAWTPVTGLDNAASASPVATPAFTTAYRVLVTDARGCIAMDSTTVTVAEPIAVDAGSGATICAGGEAQLSAKASGGSGRMMYSWSPSAGLSSSTALDPTASPDASTIYTLTATDANGCSARDTVHVTVLTPPEVEAGNALTLCPGTGGRLEAKVSGGAPPYAYQWTPADGLESATVPAPVAMPARTTTYTLTVTDARGCAASSRVTVNVHPALRVSAGEDFEICEGTHAKLNGKASGGFGKYAFSWSPKNGLNSDNVAKPLAGPLTTTVYTLTVTDGHGCSATDTVRVTVYKKPTSDAGPDRWVCPGAKVTIGTESPVIEDPVTYSWRPEEGLSDPRARNPVAEVDGPARYILTVADAHGCELSDTMRIRTYEVEPPRIAAVGGSMTMCRGDSVVLDAGEGYAAYAWSSGERTRTVALRDAGVRTVTVTTAEGCTATSRQVEVGVHERPVPAITVRGPTTICEGDDAVLEAPRATSRLWSTGDDGRVLRVSKAGTYTVAIVDENGCSGTSAPVSITVIPRPAPVLSRNDDTLTVTDSLPGATRFTWYLDGKKIAGEGFVHVPAKSGVYKVLATNANGCSTFSNPIRVKLGRRRVQ